MDHNSVSWQDQWDIILTLWNTKRCIILSLLWQRRNRLIFEGKEGSSEVSLIHQILVLFCFTLSFSLTTSCSWPERRISTYTKSIYLIIAQLLFGSFFRVAQHKKLLLYRDAKWCKTPQNFRYCKKNWVSSLLRVSARVQKIFYFKIKKNIL